MGPERPPATEGELREAVRRLTHHSAAQFSQLEALAQSLLALLGTDQFYDAPWLAAHQLEAMACMAADAAGRVEEIAEALGVEAARSPIAAVLEARSVFIKGFAESP